MYISDVLGARGGTIEILAGTCMSDHSLVILVAHDGEWPADLTLRIRKSIQIDVLWRSN